MEYEWDKSKCDANIMKHGFDFADIESFDWENATIFEDVRNPYNEPRFVAYSYLCERLVVVVYTIRESQKRIISLRKANKREVRDYGI